MQNLVAHLPEIVVQLIALALAVSVHESSHGLMAERLGDPTARWLGRITLNPIKHVDLLGTIVFPLFMAIAGLPVFGWAKPVPYNPRNLRDQKWGPALVALAGPVSNMIFGGLAVVVLLVLKAIMPEFRAMLAATIQYGAGATPGIVAPLVYLLFAIALINIILAVFNLIPIPPLDGSHLLSAVLPPRWQMTYAQIGRYGWLLLIGLIYLGVFGVVLMPFLRILQWLLFS